MEDQQIIAMYFARNEAAIQETDSKYGKLCYKVADGILHRKEDNEECVNSTYLAAWNSMPPKKPNYLGSFLCRITRNLSLKKYESNHAKKRGSELEVTLSELEEVLPSNVDVHKAVEAKELGEALTRFLRTLKQDERNIFIKRYLLTYTAREIAADYHCKESKINSQIVRTRQKLKEFLEKEMFL